MWSDVELGCDDFSVMLRNIKHTMILLTLTTVAWCPTTLPASQPPDPFFDPELVLLSGAVLLHWFSSTSQKHRLVYSLNCRHEVLCECVYCYDISGFCVCIPVWFLVFWVNVTLTRGKWLQKMSELMNTIKFQTAVHILYCDSNTKFQETDIWCNVVKACLGGCLYILAISTRGGLSRSLQCYGLNR